MTEEEKSKKRKSMKENILYGLFIVFMLIAVFSATRYIESNIVERGEQQIRDINKTNDQRMQDIEKRLERLEEQNREIRETNQNLQEIIERLNDNVSRGRERIFPVTVTAYDLSVQSCGKTLDSPGYGMTASGESLEGHSLWSARAIAVDPSVIPLGSEVRIVFDDSECEQYNGIYRAVDTGGGVTGNHIDLFFGDTGSEYPSNEALSFGIRTARAMIM